MLLEYRTNNVDVNRIYVSLMLLLVSGLRCCQNDAINAINIGQGNSGYDQANRCTQMACLIGTIMMALTTLNHNFILYVDEGLHFC